MVAPAASVPHWKDHKLKDLARKEGTVSKKLTKEDWNRFENSAVDSFDAMNYDWFVPAAESLVLDGDVFDQIAAPPALDVFTSAIFRKAVVRICVAEGLIFPIAAHNVNPSSDPRYAANYDYIILQLRSIQSQLSTRCSDTMDTVFTVEARTRHPLKAMRI